MSANPSKLLKDYLELIKFRLTASVVGSALFGYLVAVKVLHTHDFSMVKALGVVLGGFFTVAASNGLNQLIEKEQDSLMKRTSARPIAMGRISEAEARLFCLLSAFAGFAILWIACNPLSAWLGLISLVLYAFLYTPLKGVTPLSVLVGAFPGALPPLIGWTAGSYELDAMGLTLFGFQFFWQFPHFWSIAWMLHDDYQAAGYWLLPTPHGRSKNSSLQIIVYSVLLIAVSIMPISLGMVNNWFLLFALPLGGLILFRAFRLHSSLETADARKLMFTTLFYSPLMFIGLLIC
ncbi:MAG: heme o synthase [Bacteroidetes bacterium]|nr:heme o synthase [Bacteroidota bacterium]